MQRTFLFVSNVFFCFFNDPIPTWWNARLTTTFKCSHEAFLVSTTLPSPPIVMALTHARRWARLMFLGCLPLKGFTSGTHFLRILEHVDWEIPNNLHTSHVLCPCCNRAIAFNLFSFGNVSRRIFLFVHVTSKFVSKTPNYVKVNGSWMVFYILNCTFNETGVIGPSWIYVFASLFRLEKGCTLDTSDSGN